MASECCEKPRVEIPFYISLLLVMVSIILFIFGGVYYRREHPKEIIYREDICLVLSLGYRNDTCQARYSRYHCYSAVWDVRLSKSSSINATAESEKRYRSIDQALNAAIEHQINTQAPCWYNLQQPSVVQWRKPSTRTARILLIFGGLSMFFVVFFLCLSCCCYSTSDSLGRYSLHPEKMSHTVKNKPTTIDLPKT